MKGERKKQILEFIKKNGASRPHDIVSVVKISPQALHRHLKDLVAQNQLVKLGAPPLVFYKLATKGVEISLDSLSDSQQDYIEENFSRLLPNGSLIYGIDAFKSWLDSTKQVKAYQSLAQTYVSLHEDIKKKKDELSVYDLSEKITETFDEVFLQGVFCSDFYSLPQFGKTRLGNLITAAKSGQHKESIALVFEETRDAIDRIIKRYEVDTIVWTPHSVQRKILFLEEYKKLLKLSLPEIVLSKVYAGRIPVAQKSLSKLHDRIENARETILVRSVSGAPKSVLIIDDAIGSGATINEIAHKISLKFDTKTIYAYAVVGSFKGFDVLSVV